MTFEPIDADAFADEIESLLALYDWEATCAQLNLLDSHDMARALWILGENTAALRQAVLFLMTMPGAPCIYYGDEIGLSAAGDPHCREAFPWDKQEDWNADLLSFYRDATALRHRHEVLRTGRVELLQATGRTLVVRRTLDDQTAIVAFNAGSTAATIEIEASDLPTRPLSPTWPPTAETDLAPQNPASTIRLSPHETRVWTSD
jgi:neopullulanase